MEAISGYFKKSGESGRWVEAGKWASQGHDAAKNCDFPEKHCWRFWNSPVLILCLPTSKNGFVPDKRKYSIVNTSGVYSINPKRLIFVLLFYKTDVTFLTEISPKTGCILHTGSFMFNLLIVLTGGCWFGKWERIYVWTKVQNGRILVRFDELKTQISLGSGKMAFGTRKSL